MSLTKTTDSINLKNIPMQQLRKSVEKELEDNGFSVSIENQSDLDLGLNISKRRYNSYLKMYRTKHRPLTVEMEIDYNYFQNRREKFKEQQKKDKPRNQRSGMGSSLFRYYWIYWIFGGIILYTIISFSEIFMSFLDWITPGWGPVSRALLFVGISILVIAFYVYLLPILKDRRNSSAKKKDEQVLNIVKTHLQDLELSSLDSDTIKCWSCFEDITIGTEKCPNCGKLQN